MPKGHRQPRDPRLVAAGKLGALLRHRGADDPAVPLARRDLRVLDAEGYLCDLLQFDPPPTAEQRRRLAELLLTGAS